MNLQIPSIAITYPFASNIHFYGSRSKFLSSLSGHRIREVIAVEVDLFIATWRRNIATQMDFVALCDAQIERNRKS